MSKEKVLLKIYRAYSRDEAIAYLVKELKGSEFEKGQLTSEIHRLEHQAKDRMNHIKNLEQKINGIAEKHLDQVKKLKDEIKEMQRKIDQDEYRKKAIHEKQKIQKRLLKTAERCAVLLRENEELKSVNVADVLSSSLGECVEGNDYEIVADEDGRFWINHKVVGSGEPLEQWINDAIQQKLESL